MIDVKTKLTDKEKLFCAEYVKDPNQTKAYKKVFGDVKYAAQSAMRLMVKPNIKEEIRRIMESVQDENIASIKEILESLTTIARGKISEEVVSVIGTGRGFSETSITLKKVDIKDRIRALELLGKRYALFDSSRNENENEGKVRIYFDRKEAK